MHKVSSIISEFGPVLYISSMQCSQPTLNPVHTGIWYTVTEHGILTLREELMNTLTGSDFGIALLEPVWAYMILSGFLFPGMIFSQQ